jgi:hypothetical protein
MPSGSLEMPISMQRQTLHVSGQVIGHYTEATPGWAHPHLNVLDRHHLHAGDPKGKTWLFSLAVVSRVRARYFQQGPLLSYSLKLGTPLLNYL